MVLGDADCCIATRSAVQAFGLGFVPLKIERYDLVMIKCASFESLPSQIFIPLGKDIRSNSDPSALPTARFRAVFFLLQ